MLVLDRVAVNFEVKNVDYYMNPSASNAYLLL
jgi:hypothetical protein